LLSHEKRFEEAAALFSEGVTLDPENAVLRMSYGETLLDLDRPEEAVPQFREVLRGDPESADAMASLGGALLRTDQSEEAAKVLTQCVHYLPEDSIVHELLGEALARSGEPDPALASYRRALALGRRTRRVLFSCGNLLSIRGEFAHADEAFRHGMDIPGDEPPPWHNWGRARFELGDVSGAVDAFRQSLGQGVEASLRDLAVILPGDPTARPAQVLETRRRLAESVALPADGWSPAPRAGAKIRVGYMSSFFAKANYMKPVYALLVAHDPSRVEVELFHDGPEAADLRQRMDGTAVEGVHEVKGVPSPDLVEIIRGRQLDVLVDLNAYSATHRLPIYTVRLARVAVGWFNHYATSGLPGIDVIVGDARTVDAGEESDYSERVVRLPHSYLSFRVDHPAPEVVPPPCLERGAITFGSLCSQYKITPPVLRAWCRLLQEAPTARLILANRTLGSPDAARYVGGAFAEAGIADERVELRGPAEHLAYLANYDDIDIALDTWPYNGGTTTTEALWQGVSVLCFSGDRWASRTSASLLAESPFRDFLCESEQAMLERAIRLAADPQTATHLAGLRSSARIALRQSPVCDAARFAGEMEDLFARLLVSP
jgi:predicted O-linked N-acetylglucosamine transferase (SPINDLY family)